MAGGSAVYFTSLGVRVSGTALAAPFRTPWQG